MADEEWILESICPHGAISGTDVDRNICKECKEWECITRHNTKGMYLSYEEESVEDILREALYIVRIFYVGGGVSFTGGDASVQLN